MTEVLQHIRSGSEWGFYELDPNSPFNNYEFNFQSSFDGFVSLSGKIIIENNEAWKRQGEEGLRYRRDLDMTALTISAGTAGASCRIGGPYACAIGVGGAIITVLSTTVDGPTYYPQYPRAP